MNALPQNAAEALKLLVNAKFRPFDDMDWSAWAGCESAEPMIAETDEITVILDGETVTFNSYNEGTDMPEWTCFTLRFDDSY